MLHILRTQEAELDIDSIWDYLAIRNLSAAERFLTRLEKIGTLIASQPQLGMLCEHLAPGMRAFPIKGFQYVLFYQIVSDGVCIVRILHGARDIPALFPSA